MSKSRLLLALLFLISLVSIANGQGTELEASFSRGFYEINQILRLANGNLQHYPAMDREATYYPLCSFITTTLAMNIENAKTRQDDIGVMISKKSRRQSFESIAEMWTNNTSFLRMIQDSTEYGCAVNTNCGSEWDVLSCAFDNPQPLAILPTLPVATTHVPTIVPVSYSKPKPYALTREMFQDILDQLKPAHPNMYYDEQFFMDHGSASYWQCPFPNQHSDTHYVVGNGKVELTKNRDFGVIMELGRGVPYRDSDMREAMKKFARKWSTLQFNRYSPTKFGCSVDPDCHGDMILLCAFYPIDSTSWILNPNLPHPVPTPSPILGPHKYTDIMNRYARNHFGLSVSDYLEDECLHVTKCEGSVSHRGFNKTYSERLQKPIVILTGSTLPSQINHDISIILSGMENRKFSSYPYQFGCCYIPDCQKIVLSTCVFAQM